MAEYGIKVYAGASGKADDAIESYIAGTLAEIGEATLGFYRLRIMKNSEKIVKF